MERIKKILIYGHLLLFWDSLWESLIERIPSGFASIEEPMKVVLRQIWGYHRTMKNIVKLENYFYPDDLRAKIKSFVNYYNNKRYHESLKNITPADVYFDRDSVLLNRRDEIKTIKERRKKNQKIKISAQYFNSS